MSQLISATRMATTRLPVLMTRPGFSPAVLFCSMSSKAGSSQGKKSGSTSTQTSDKVDPPPFVFKGTNTKDVGPGAGKDKDYKNPEYFSYHKMSFADMDIVMEKFRLQQPSSVKK